MIEEVTKAKRINVRIGPKKVVPVLNLVRNRGLKDAMIRVAFDKTKAAKIILKLLKSAGANAESTGKGKTDSLVVKDAWVGSGRVMKSGQFVGKGRFSPILKRFSNIYISLGERK